MIKPDVRYITLYAGCEIYAIEITPESNSWDEAHETPPTGTIQERLAYAQYLAEQVENTLPLELRAKKYLRRLRQVTDMGLPLAIPLVDEQKALERQVENAAATNKAFRDRVFS